MGDARVTIIETPERFAELRDEWNVFVRQRRASPFSTHEWLSTYWSVYGTGARLCVVLVRDGNGQVIGVCPLQVRSRGVAGIEVATRAAFLGAPLTDIQDVLMVPGREAEVLGLIVDAVADQGIDYLDLEELPEGAPIRACAEQLATRMDVEERPSSRLPFVSLPGDWPSFLASRGISTQRNMKYYSNRLTKKFRFEFVALTEPEEILRELPEFFRLYAKRFADVPELIGAEYEGFRRHVAGLFAKNGWLVLFVVKLDGRAVAAEFGLRGDGTLYAYNACYDADWSREGTTLVLQGRILEYAINAGFREYNFLRGEEPYKAHWATDTRQQYALHLRQRTWRVRMIEGGRTVRELAARGGLGTSGGAGEQR